MQIYSTLGRSLAPFEPVVPNKVGIYVCGPTVQSDPHVGHGRSAVAFDVLRRYLVWRGYDVTYVRNVTDIEDKIIQAARTEGISTDELARRVGASFERAQDDLAVLRPDIEPRATDHIDEILAMISELIDREIAYEAEGDVYFSVRAHAGYGKLSGRNLDDLLSGARVEPTAHKRDPLDFALWKAAKPGEPSWDAPWGPGRPGWHIECSAMARKYLGDTFDIHGGGSDLIFPHHENEIAQSEAATGVRFAKYWLHNGMVTLSGEKMAKSTGHVIDLLGTLERYPPLAVRLLYLRAQYRSPLEFSEDLLVDATSSYERLAGFVRRTESLEDVAPDASTMERFVEAMDDDINTPVALAVVFDAIKEGNRRIEADGDAASLAAAIRTMLDVLGLLETATVGLDDLAEELAELASAFDVESEGPPEDIVGRLVEARATARANRQWDVADRLRDQLAGVGIVIEDSADGVRWRRT